MHIAIIGGGASGLCAARHVLESNDMTCVVFEQTNKLGGTWVYTEKIGDNEYGLPIHSSMYKNLRTNLPKETMEFSDFPWKKNKSFLSADVVLNYLLDYAEHFKITEHVKFHHLVTRVHPAKSGWEVTAQDLETKNEVVEHFDSVMVCNGHYTVPDIPDIEGLSQFVGKIIHSHYYRVPEEYAGKTVLVIGGGPSGVDISLDMSKFAKKIYFTHHTPDFIKVKMADNIEQVPEICRITENGAVFEDGTSCSVDVIMFCTGYKYTLPFLTPECGITIEQDRYVQPLYKHLVYIYNPTLCIVGLVFFTILFPLFDIQIRFFLNTLRGVVKLPSTAEMLEDTAEEIRKKREEGVRLKNYHKLGPGRVVPYFDWLSEMSQEPLLPRVIFKIYNKSTMTRKQDISSYRENNYEIVDDERFTLNGVLYE